MEFDPISTDTSTSDSASKPTPTAAPFSASDPLQPAFQEPPPEDPPPAKRKGRKRRYLIVYPLITLILAAATGIVVAASIRRPQVDTLDDFVPRLITGVQDQRGNTIATYSRENRVLLEEGDLPAVLENAILAVEDANFYDHGGIDLKGIVRAAIANIRSGSIEEGASTITMQLARDLFALTRQQNFKRKIEEAFLAVELEKKFSKQQLITMYANLVNLSQGNYGMEAASRNYFNKTVAELSLAEAATLAGIPQRPSHHNPYARPEAVQARRDVVLGRMLAEGFISQTEHDAAVAEPMVVIKPTREKTLGPYFSEEVRRYLIKTYGETQLYDRGLQVTTTLNQDIQRATETALREELLRLEHSRGWRGAIDHVEDDLENFALASWRRMPEATEDLIPGEWFQGLVLESERRKALIKAGPHRFELTVDGIGWTRKRQVSSLLKVGDVAWFRLQQDEGDEAPRLMLEQEPQVQAAALVLESSTGAVRALVGGWDYENNEFNRITQARRQAGSVFKPFVFGAALEIGFTAADTLFDGPIVLTGADNADSYSPRNYYRKYAGIMTLRTALEDSVNVPAVKLLDMVGVEQVIDFSRRCGIQSELPPYPSLALGSADLVPLEVAAAYATFVNQGVYVEPYFIQKIENRNGRILEEHQTRAHKAMSPGVAYVLTNMLQGVATHGTAAGRLAKLDIPTAGKTGTTNSFSDAWFVGYTPRYTVLTWVGYDKKRSLGRGWTGAHAALPIWDSIVRKGLEDGWLSPDERFQKPPGIVERRVEVNTGLLAGPGASQMRSEVFIEGTEPVKRFDHQWARVIQLPWYLQEPFYLPKEGERMPDQVDDWAPIVEGWSNKGKGG